MLPAVPEALAPDVDHGVSAIRVAIRDGPIANRPVPGSNLIAGDPDPEPDDVARAALGEDVPAIPLAHVDLVPGGVHAAVRCRAQSIGDAPPIDRPARQGCRLDLGRPPRASEVRRRQQPEARSVGAGSEPVVADIHRPVVRAARVAIDRDLGEPADPRRRASLDPKPRPGPPLVVAVRSRQAEPPGAATRRRHVRPVQARAATRSGPPGDRRMEAHAPTRASARTRPRRPPRPTAVVRDADERVDRARRAGSAMLVDDRDAVGIRRVGGDDRLPGTIRDRSRLRADGAFVDDAR